jgi:hypothetical protein
MYYATETNQKLFPVTAPSPLVALEPLSGCCYRKLHRSSANTSMVRSRGERVFNMYDPFASKLLTFTKHFINAHPDKEVPNKTKLRLKTKFLGPESV